MLPSSRRLPASLSRHTAASLLGLAACGLTAACERPATELATDLRAMPLEHRAAEGAELYAKYCALCHGKEATGYAADHAPSLVSATFLATASNAFISRGIRNGRPGTAMGAYGRSRGGPLGEDDIEAIVTFLRSPGPSWVEPPTSTPVVGDATRGEAIFVETCRPCHGTKTTRGEAVHLANPELLDSAPDAFLRHAIVRGRPGTPMVSFAGTFDDRQIDDVVSYIRGWAGPDPRVLPPAPAIPDNLPLVLNPTGPNPHFTLREELYVSAEQVKRALAANNRIVIIDARTPSEWIQLRIPGAVPAPYHDMTRLDAMPKDNTWIVAYCACPHHASGAVIAELRKRGFQKTAVLDEGILVWKTLGYPTEGESAGVRPAGTRIPIVAP